MKNSLAAENMLLGGIISKPEKVWYDCLSSGITENSFADNKNKHIFSMCQEFERTGRPISRYNIVSELSVHGNVSSFEPSLKAYGEAFISTGFIHQAIIDVKSAETGRALRKAIDVATDMLDENEDPSIVSDKMNEIMATSGTGIKVETMAGIRKSKIEQWDLAKGRGFVGVKSGLHGLNSYMGGYRQGVVTVLGGYRGQGKSTLARQEATFIAKNGTHVGLITMEDTADISAAGIAGNLGDFSVYHLDIGRSSVPVEEVDERWKANESIPLFIVDRPQTIHTLVQTANLLFHRHGCRFFVIDHIQYILPSGKGHESRNVEVGRYSAEISAMTKRLKVSTLLLSQLSRESEKEGRRPRLSDLRDSGSIEQDARAVLLLSRSDQGFHLLDIAKNNLGPSGKVLKLQRLDGKQRFEYLGEE